MNILPASIVVAGIIISGGLVLSGEKLEDSSPVSRLPGVSVAEASELPVVWGDLGPQLVEAGVIEEERFRALYQERGGISAPNEILLSGNADGNMMITEENAGFILNLLWALGLGNKNPVLEEGEMSDPRYGGAGNFASTGGWMLARGDAMDHYSQHEFVTLTPEEQALVDKVSRNIYRPCCANSAHFPDCNHGMAMLALLELMASQGANEAEMYESAIKVNSYWFPGYGGTVPKAQSVPRAGGCSV